MKNHRLTISLFFIGILMLSMGLLVLTSKAQVENLKNPYDSAKLSVNDIVATYHNNMNEAFNRYIKLMMTNLEKNPDDPNGKAFKEDGTPFTVEDCLDPANAKNYSTFCVAVNMLGGNSDNCNIPTPPPTIVLPPDMVKFCQLGGSAQALKGYLNFSAAMRKKTGLIFKTSQEKDAWNSWISTATCLGIRKEDCDQKKQEAKGQAAYQVQKALSASADLNFVNEQIKFAKETLNQTLSAYDQLRVAWPMHKKYIEVYADLEKYRDKIVDIRHQTDVFPKKFIDLTTTACL